MVSRNYCFHFHGSLALPNWEGDGLAFDGVVKIIAQPIERELRDDDRSSKAKTNFSDLDDGSSDRALLLEYKGLDFYCNGTVGDGDMLSALIPFR